MTPLERLAVALALSDAQQAPIGIAAPLFTSMDQHMQDRYRERIRAVLTEMKALDGYPFDVPEWYIALDEILEGKEAA